MTDFNDFNQKVIAEFRANAGVVGCMFEGVPLLLVTSTGAKSGAARISPLAYDSDGDRFVIIASKGGAPSHPDWYHNLRANPTATVEVGAETMQVTATEAQGEERDRLYDQMAAKMPNFAEYQRNTSRKIPVIVLERAG